MVNTSTPFLVNLKLHNEVSWFIVLLLRESFCLISLDFTETFEVIRF